MYITLEFMGLGGRDVKVVMTYPPETDTKVIQLVGPSLCHSDLSQNEVTSSGREKPIA